MIDPTHENRDLSESAIRFGCGALFGAVLSLAVVLPLLSAANPALIVAIVAASVFFGYLAVRLGDSFWFGLRKWLSWPWW